MAIKNGLRIEPQSTKYLNFNDHRRLIYRGARRALYDIGVENVRYTREIIKKGPKNGRLYRIAGRKRRHRASAPGQAPANLTGYLRRNVDFSVKGGDQMEFGDKAEYGRFLELGTRRMKARPHLSKAVKKNKQYADQRLGLEPIRSLSK